MTQGVWVFFRDLQGSNDYRYWYARRGIHPG
jgi:hypothetical protein